MAGLETVFGDLIPTFDSADELSRLLDDFASHRSSFTDRMAAARELVLAQHTFDSRALRIMEIVRELGWEPESVLA